MTHTLVVIRHGQSEWNLMNLFTGWTDVDITPEGEREARTGGKLLKKHGFEFDLAYTSVLKRAVKTLDIVLEETDQMWLPVIKDWRWNERHYGALQGFNKKEMAEKTSTEQVHIWRRSFDIPPPALEKTDERYCGNDRRYANLMEDQIPLTESLKDTIARFMPLWENDVTPLIKQGKRLIISAHGNTMRALAKHLENISDKDIPNLEIPTGVPLIYKLDDDLNLIERSYLKE